MPDAFVVDGIIASCQAVTLSEEDFAGTVIFSSLRNATVVASPDAGMLNQ